MKDLDHWKWAAEDADAAGEDPLLWLPPEDTPDPPKTDENWYPDLNPTQRLIFDDTAMTVIAHGEKACRSLDTQIYTADGLARLHRLRPPAAVVGKFTAINQPIIAFDGRTTVEAVASQFWSEASDEAISARLSNGADLVGSPIHPVWTCWSGPSEGHGFGYVQLGNIAKLRAEGFRFWTPLLAHPQWTKTEPVQVQVMRIVKTCKICGKAAIARGLCHTDYARMRLHKRLDEFPNREATSIIITAPLAYALGALVGDGALNILNDHRSIGFTNNDEECVRGVRSGLAEIGTELHATPNDMQFLVCGGLIKPLLKALDLCHTSYYKRIPDAIIESPRNVAAAFISGLFDTDGTVGKLGEVSFCTTSEQLGLGLDVQNLLAAFGLLCVRRPRKSASGRPTWTLSLMGRNAWQFGREIGFRIARKQARILGPKISQKCPTGFNRNNYGFPTPICRDMKAIAFASRDGNRSRSWHDYHRSLHSFGSVPSLTKLEKFCALYDCKDRMREYLISEEWLEVVETTSVRTPLADLHVPGHNSFLASGTINHNSGKTTGLCHSGVRHCYETFNALWLLITVTISVGTEGVWFDLVDLILPAWRNGNRFPDYLKGERHPRSGELMDTGIGLHFTDPKLDPNSKDRHIWVYNKHDGWSKILLKSIPHPLQVETRVKGPSPSRVYVDELTNCEGSEYYTYPALQLSRRRRTYTPMQYTASCNPRGPSHWVYQQLILPAEEGNKNISVHHVPLQENLHRLPPQYVKRLDETLKDPYLRRQLLDGEWVDRPAGDAIFKEYFIFDIHVKGNSLKNIGLVPIQGFPIIVSHDPGPKNYCITFEQRIPTKDPGLPYVWIVFDELNYVGQYKPYPAVVKDMLRRMRYWTDHPKARFNYAFRHIADEAAFTARNKGGSFDSMDIQRFAKEQGATIKLIPSPKVGPDSQPQRVQMLIDMLLSDMLFISAQLEKTIDMLRILPSKNVKEGEYDAYAGLRPQKCPQLHPFDSLTYGPWRYHVLPGRATVVAPTEKARVFWAGQRRS